MFYKTLLILLAAGITGTVIVASDWPTQSGSPQRDGWARWEKNFSKENVGGLDLLYRHKADNESKGLYSLTAPIIDGLLITYRGFKEMLVFSGSGDNVYSVDADLNRLIWKTHFEYGVLDKAAAQKTEKKHHALKCSFCGNSSKPKHPPRKSSSNCPNALTASIAMAGSSSAAASFGKTANAKSSTVKLIGGSGASNVGAFFAVASDGYLHTLNPSTGGDLIPPVKFVPANSRTSALNVDGNTIYAATSGNCGDSANALYAVDLGSADKKVNSLPTASIGVSGIEGTAIGNDGTVYVQVPFEQGRTDKTYHRTLLALEPLTLAVKDYFTFEDTATFDKNTETVSATPIVFPWKGKDLIVAAGDNGRLYLLDSTVMGGPDHQKPLFETEVIANTNEDYSGNGFREGFSSWNDTATGTRWIYASLWGAPAASAKFPVRNGDVSNGAVAAFKVVEQDGQVTLSPAWISADIASPAPVVNAGGVVFALSTGAPMDEAKGKGKPYKVAEVKKAASHATLYALDGETGKQLYSSADLVTSPSFGSGLAVANGRIYFATSDNTVYAFGFSKMQPQLTDK